MPFLYQENKFISWEQPKDEDTTEKDEDDDNGSDDAEETKKRSGTKIRTGISITLSKIKFEVTDMAGYQKPKPRQFL